MTADERKKLIAKRDRNHKLGVAAVAVISLALVGAFIVTYGPGQATRPVVPQEVSPEMALALCTMSADVAPAGFETGSATPVCDPRAVAEITGRTDMILVQVPEGWVWVNHYRSKKDGKGYPYHRPCKTVDRMLWVPRGAVFADKPVAGMCPGCGNYVVVYPPNKPQSSPPTQLPPPTVTPPPSGQPTPPPTGKPTPPPTWTPPPPTGKYNNDPVWGDNNGDYRGPQDDENADEATRPGEDSVNPGTPNNPGGCNGLNPEACNPPAPTPKPSSNPNPTPAPTATAPPSPSQTPSPGTGCSPDGTCSTPTPTGTPTPADDDFVQPGDPCPDWNCN